jgi:hypothetical protein
MALVQGYHLSSIGRQSSAMRFCGRIILLMDECMVKLKRMPLFQEGEQEGD